MNRIDSRAFHRDLNRGNPTGRFRLPLRESPQFFRARASWSNPALKASFEHSPHQGATTSLTAFQSLRNEYNDHDTGGVRSASSIP